MRILFVEDDPLIAMTAEQTLREAGHEVIGPFATARSALAAAENVHADVAIVDINLEGSDDGPAVARALRDAHGMPSVFATSQPNAAWQNRDAALGVLQKPYSDEGLCGMV